MLILQHMYLPISPDVFVFNLFYSFHVASSQQVSINLNVCRYLSDYSRIRRSDASVPIRQCICTSPHLTSPLTTPVVILRKAAVYRRTSGSDGAVPVLQQSPAPVPSGAGRRWTAERRSGSQRRYPGAAAFLRAGHTAALSLAGPDDQLTGETQQSCPLKQLGERTGSAQPSVFGVRVQRGAVGHWDEEWCLRYLKWH